MPKTKLKVGDKVTYVTQHSPPEIGIVKIVPEERPDSVWVVYNCGGNWERMNDYTSCMTHVRDLVLGWPKQRT